MIRINNARALFVEENRIWIAKGLKFYAIDFFGKQISKTYHVGNPIFKIRLIRQLLRKGIHHLIPLDNGCFLVSLKKKTLVIDDNCNIVSIFTGFHGNKPAQRGICKTPEGILFFAEYSLNPDRDIEVNLYRSDDNGLNFRIVKTFAPGEIRHIHFVEWDKYDNCIWLGTGDYGKGNSECRLYKSYDYGQTFELVGSGSQNWRSIGVCITKNYLYWGTDAGSCKDANHFNLYDKQRNKLSIIDLLPGPCHGMCVNKNGSIYVSTGVEGGENEQDRYARLYKYQDNNLLEIKEIKKDAFPLIVQYGVIRFPCGCENSKKIVYTTMGLKSCGETVFIDEDLDYEKK